MKKLLMLLITLNVCLLLNAQQASMDLIVYNTSNTPVFSTNNFKSIGVGKNGHIWAGTANQGLYKFDGNIWEKSATALTNHNIADIKTDRNGGIWIGQYGSAGAQATGGGINFFSDANFSNVYYNPQHHGLPTRNVRSLYLNNSDAITVINPSFRVWSANMADIEGGLSRTGAVGRGTNFVVPFSSLTNGVDVSNQAGSCQTIGGNTNEVWVFASVNNANGHSQLLRYNTSTNAFIGFYDSNSINLQLQNTPLPSNFTAKAIYFDKDGRAWVGMQTGGVYVFENNTWKHINFPDIFPQGVIINNNAITGDTTGRVFIGTTAGLVVFQGSNTQNEIFYNRYTGNNDFQLGSVQAIAIDTISNNPHSVVLATINGIARWKMKTPIEVFNIVNGNPSAIRHTFDYIKTNQNIMVAVDGTTSTLLKVTWPNPGEYELRIKNNNNPANPANKSKYGEFTFAAQDNSSKSYLYTHPSDPEIQVDKFSRKEILQVINSTTGDVYYEETIEFVRPPLLLVHGLFSSGEEAFGNMRNMLLNDGLYKPKQINTPNYPGELGFDFTFPVVHYEIGKTLEMGIKAENISCGKIDAGGHSMGGLLLRLYLQHNSYKNDINKFIPFNSPHMGSPFPNWILSSTGIGEVLRTAIESHIASPYGGALSDLKVNSSPIINKLIGNVQNENKVPTHAIVTTTDILSDIQFYLSSVSLPTNFKAIRYARFLNVVAYILNTAKEFATDVIIPYINNTLYAGVPHDLAVSRISQICGLEPNHYSAFTEKWHSSTSEPRSDIYNKFKLLLSTSVNDNIFSKTGFTPGAPIPVPDNLYRLMQPQAGTLEITGPADNSSLSAGSSFALDLNYTLVDTMIVLLSDNSKSLYAARIYGPSTSFNFEIPNEFIGDVKILVMGFNQSGFSAMDSLKIITTTNATLEEITIEPEVISVPKTGYTSININGLFSDDVQRDLTGHEGISYSFAHNKASFQAPNEIIGLDEGLDTLTVSFQGKSAILPIEITSQSNWVLLDNNMNPLPTKLGSLSARLRNSTVSLEWKAYEDLDVSIYEVQHSKDGARFTTIGHLNPAHVSTERTYQYTHPDYVTGNNFYRIKVTEFNGKVIYTNIATVRVNSHLSIKLAPNPVRHTLEIIVNAKKDDIASIIITDVSGKNVYLQQHRINNGINNISIPAYSLANGLYIVRMETTTEKIAEKFIKTD